MKCERHTKNMAFYPEELEQIKYQARLDKVLSKFNNNECMLAMRDKMDESEMTIRIQYDNKKFYLVSKCYSYDPASLELDLEAVEILLKKVKKEV
jgi:hypothetical protein